MKPDPKESLELHLVSVDDEEEKINVRTHKTEGIAAFKLRVANMFCISAKDQLNLFYRGEPLRDEMTVGDYVNFDNVMKVQVLSENVEIRQRLKVIGPIPGIDVGTSWSLRTQAKQAGIHEKHIDGISGTEGGVAYSVALSGGYQNVDNGDIIVYTGSGGRPIDGIEYLGQEFSKMNKSLANNCKAAFNSKGAVAERWEEGTSVRVLRKVGLNCNSPYARKDFYS